MLDHVDVQLPSRTAVTITLFEGRDPTPDDVACIEIGVVQTD